MKRQFEEVAAIKSRANSKNLRQWKAISKNFCGLECKFEQFARAEMQIRFEDRIHPPPRCSRHPVSESEESG